MKFKEGDEVYVDGITNYFGKSNINGYFKVERIINHMNTYVMLFISISLPIIDFSITTTCSQYHKIKTFSEIRSMKMNKLNK